MNSICKLSFFINLLNYYEPGIVNIIISFIKPQILELNEGNIEFFWPNTTNICGKYYDESNSLDISKILNIYNIKIKNFVLWKTINNNINHINHINNITIIEYKGKIITENFSGHSLIKSIEISVGGSFVDTMYYNMIQVMQKISHEEQIKEENKKQTISDIIDNSKFNYFKKDSKYKKHTRYQKHSHYNNKKSKDNRNFKYPRKYKNHKQHKKYKPNT